MLRRLLKGLLAPAAAAAPDLDALLNEGVRLRRSGKLQQAELLLRKAIAAAPTSASVHVHLGVVLAELGQLEEATQLFSRAVTLDPDDPYAQMNLANAYRRRADFDKALEHYRAAVRVKPDLVVAWSNMLRPLLDSCDWAGISRALEAIVQPRGPDEPEWRRYIPPMDALLLPLPPETCREIAEYHARQLETHAARRNRAPPARRDRLRIGYFSRDLRNHAVGQLARALFRNHDRSRFEVLAYSYGRNDGSRYRREIAEAVDRFVDVRDESLPDTATRIANDGVDILVDLGGYTTEHRLAVLAQRPAPVQVHYLGYPATLGARFIDYFVTDHIASPEGQDRFFTERLVRLPSCFMVSDPDQPLADRPLSRAACSLPENAAVFCAFHQTAKITQEVFDAWVEILHEVPHGVLWLRSTGEAATRNLTARAHERGVDPQRLVFAPNLVEKRSHVARMAAADVFLDTFGRYNGHSTVNEALWASVPVVTIAGATFASRVATSLVAAAGVPEFAVSGRDEYVQLAVRLALDAAERAALRRRLAEARCTAPLFDAARIVRALERAYETMWTDCTAGVVPHAFSVPDEPG
jgi:predicted O-linked N-acetylglucosamine transferase (SPINDLY family)